MKTFWASILFLAFITSCSLLEDTQEVGPDIAEGLKEALRVGTDTATKKLAVADGYLKDQAVKILLPDELEEQITKFKAIEVDVFGLATMSGSAIWSQGIPLLDIPSMSDLEDQMITGINRAAESAASEAGPIFFNAITDITIADANDILFGADDAATVYLRNNTYESLFQTFEPKINSAITNVKVGEKSVEEIYANFVTTYNGVLSKQIPTGFLASESLADLAGLDILENPDISEFATGKGLDGLFIKIEDEEANIRKDPFARVTDLLKEVFGQLD